MHKVLWSVVIIGSIGVGDSAIGSSRRPDMAMAKAAPVVARMQVFEVNDEIPSKNPAEMLAWLRAKYATVTAESCTKMAEALAQKRNASELNRIGAVCYKAGIKAATGDMSTCEPLMLAFALFCQAAAIGCICGQNNAACCLELGHGTSKDEKAAVALYQQFADKNSSVKNNLADCLQLGIGIEKDEKAAYRLFKEAADAGNVFAKHHMARCVFDGCGVDKDEKAAVELYKKAAALGNADAMHDLSYCYSSGRGVEQNEAESTAWSERAMMAGYTPDGELITDDRCGVITEGRNL